MTTASKQSTDQTYDRLGHAIVTSLAEAFEFVDVGVELSFEHVRRLHPDDFTSKDDSRALILTEVGVASGNAPIAAAFSAAEAITLVHYKRGTSNDELAERRVRGTIENDDLAPLTQIGQAVCTSLRDGMRKSLEREVDLSYANTGFLGPREALDTFADTNLLRFQFSITIGHFPEAVGAIVMEASTAESLTGVAWSEGAEEDQIPQAPIIGRLACYLTDPSALKVVRQACRRVGLELDRHSRTEVPNPAAHRDDVVLLDVPNGEDKRFEWCRRLKDYDASIQVVLVLHYPSRSKVLKAFKAQADAVLAWPMSEPALSPKLRDLLSNSGDDDDDLDDDY